MDFVVLFKIVSTYCDKQLDTTKDTSANQPSVLGQKIIQFPPKNEDVYVSVAKKSNLLSLFFLAFSTVNDT